MRRLDRAEMRERVVSLLAGRHLQEIDAQIERSASGERLKLGHEIVAEDAAERRLDPLRKVSGDGRRRAVERHGSKALAFDLRQGLRRVTLAGEECSDR